MGTKQKKQEEFAVLEKEVALREIILFDDDHNTFDFVIESLIDICGHSLLQAEQCTMLVHYKGKCAVKTGDYNELEPKCSRLLELGLTAEIV